MDLSDFINRLVAGESCSSIGSIEVAVVVDNARSPMCSFTKQAQQLRGSCPAIRKPEERSSSSTRQRRSRTLREGLSSSAPSNARKRVLQERSKVKYPVSRWQSYPGPTISSDEVYGAKKKDMLRMQMSYYRKAGGSSTSEGMASLAELARRGSWSEGKNMNKQPLICDYANSMSMKMPVRRGSGTNLNGLMCDSSSPEKKNNTSSSSPGGNMNFPTSLVTTPSCVKTSNDFFTTTNSSACDVKKNSTIEMISSVLDDLDLMFDDGVDVCC